jgi:hypothetical protein
MAHATTSSTSREERRIVLELLWWQPIPILRRITLMQYLCDDGDA